MGEKNQIAGRWMCVEFFYVVDILYICRKLLSTCTFEIILVMFRWSKYCLLYTSPSPRDLSTSRMPSSA